MVNLEENLKKKPYICPVMDVERFDFADIVTTSPYSAEGGGNDLGGDNEHDPYPTIDEL